ncbi:MAG TPA: septum formation family protein [Marmoricola sp.]|nr:septum formation family protein [Marmoricola sp.]
MTRVHRWRGGPSRRVLRLPARRVVASSVLAALLVLTGCTGDDDPDRPEPTTTASPTPSETPEPPPRPRADACYRLTLEEATAPTSDAEPVPCRRRHTTQTIHVGRLTNLVDGDRVVVDSTRIQRQLARTCPSRFRSFLGGTPQAQHLSRFQVVWFSPTLEEHDAGADWFRCDLVAFGKGDDLLPLSRRLPRGVLDRPGALDTYGLCGTARPGSRRFTRVACTLDHSWVAVGTIPIKGGDRYPGVRRVRAAGDEACAERVRSEAGFPLQFSYGWEWPTKQQWAAGQRFGFCWAPA